MFKYLISDSSDEDLFEDGDDDNDDDDDDDEDYVEDNSTALQRIGSKQAVSQQFIPSNSALGYDSDYLDSGSEDDSRTLLSKRKQRKAWQAAKAIYREEGPEDFSQYGETIKFNFRDGEQLIEIPMDYWASDLPKLGHSPKDPTHKRWDPVVFGTALFLFLY